MKKNKLLIFQPTYLFSLGYVMPRIWQYDTCNDTDTIRKNSKVLGEFFSIHLNGVLSSVDGAGMFFELFRFNVFPEYWILARLIFQTT